VSRPTRIDPRRAVNRLFISGGCGVAAGVLSSPRLPGGVATLLGWDVASFVLLALIWTVIVPATPSSTRSRAGAEDPGRTLVYVLVVITSSASLLAATLMVGRAHAMSPDLARLVAVLCLVAVALSWSVTHTAFAMRYARLYYREDREGIGGIDLPGDTPPAYFDFAYFAFTIGMCFQTSDACVSSAQIRKVVLLHAVISFAYNSVILAFVLNLVFGMAT
jgi:uncharacterized membrane protein